jgi:hypothetical protein
MKSKTSESYSIGFISIASRHPRRYLEIPYRGGTLSGAALQKRSRSGIEYGTIERVRVRLLSTAFEHPSG